MNITSTDVKVDFRINKMPRSVYDQLCADGYVAKHPFDLYLIDDDNYDVQNKRVINMEDPENGKDGVNLSYASQNFISKTDITETKDNSFYIQNSKIIYTDRTRCLSCDGKFYDKLSGDSDWIIDVISGEYDPTTLTVYYRDDVSQPPLGWTIKTPTDPVAFPYNIEDQSKSIQKLTKRFEDSTGQLKAIITIRRDKWNNTPTNWFINASELKNMLSGIDSAANFEELKTVLIGFRNSL